MQVPVHNLTGEVVKNIEISDQLFAITPNQAVIHQALVRQLANARQGTASTKTRGEVSGSSKKLFRQKGTGNARAGSIKSPLRPGGGIIFGPHPRDYSKDMPKKMRRLALKSLLSSKSGEGEIMILEQFGLSQLKTREMASILIALGIDSSALIVTDRVDHNVVKSARNLPLVKTLTADLLNIADLLNYKKLLLTEAAVRKIEEIWGQDLTRKAN